MVFLGRALLSFLMPRAGARGGKSSFYLQYPVRKHRILYPCRVYNGFVDKGLYLRDPTCMAKNRKEIYFLCTLLRVFYLTKTGKIGILFSSLRNLICDRRQITREDNTSRKC